MFSLILLLNEKGQLTGKTIFYSLCDFMDVALNTFDSKKVRLEGCWQFVIFERKRTFFGYLQHFKNATQMKTKAWD